MRISSIRPLVMGTGWRNLTFVVVETDEGLQGVGEVRMINHTDALLGYLNEAARNHVLGSDPFAVEDLVQRMWRRDYARAGEIMMSAIAVVETACLDIVGKALDVPVYTLLGGPVRERIKAYANGWYRVERTPEEFHAAALRVVERGYRGLKLDPFGDATNRLERRELVRSVELVEAVREAVGPDAEIFVEMHGRFTPAAAIGIARELERFSPAWIEEPIPPENTKGLARVAAGITCPLATGERIHARHDFRELLELQCVDFLQPDLTMCGGVREGCKIAAWADVYSVLVAPHNVGGPVSTAAGLHFAAATPNFVVLEHFNDFAEEFVKAAAPGNPEVVDGHFALPRGPGLGVVLDEALIAEHPRGDVYFDLFFENWHLRQPTPASYDGPRSRGVRQT
jgi:galactonate dehydratase